MAVFNLIGHNPTMGQRGTPHGLIIKILLVTGLFPVAIAACSASEPHQPFTEREYPFPAQYELEILLDGVQLELSGHSQEEYLIIGTDSSEYASLDLEGPPGKTTLQLSQPRPSPQGALVVVHIPPDRHVRVIQDSGSIQVRDLIGSLSIETISAPISVQGFHGHARVSSRRGPIQITESEGEIDVLAEADDIQFRAVEGIISGTNIMGAVNFHGQILQGDSVRLETDHGAVNVILDRKSNLEMELTSAGGRIICTLPGLSGTMEQCLGIYGNGGGALWIRTVSGSIRIDPSQ